MTCAATLCAKAMSSQNDSPEMGRENIYSISLQGLSSQHLCILHHDGC